MRRVVVIKCNVEVSEITTVLVTDFFYERFRCQAFITGLEHDGSAVGILRADIVNLMPPKTLKTGPDVSLNVLHQMAQVNWPIGVRQGAGGQDLARDRGHAGHSGGERWPVKSLRGLWMKSYARL